MLFITFTKQSLGWLCVIAAIDLGLQSTNQDGSFLLP